MHQVADDGPRALSRTSPADNLSPLLHATWQQQWGVDAAASMAAAMLQEPPLDLTIRAPPLPPPRRVRRALLQAKEGLGAENSESEGTTTTTATILEDAFLGGESEAGLSWRASWCRALGAEALPTGSLRIRPTTNGASEAAVSQIDNKGGDGSSNSKSTTGTGAVTSLPGFKEGAWWVQDAAAAVPALALVSALQQQAAGIGAAYKDSCTSSDSNLAAPETVISGAEGSRTAAVRRIGGDGSTVDVSASSTVVELKDRCRSLGLAVGGRKQELIDRLTAHYESVQVSAESDCSNPTSVISSSSSRSSSNSGSSSISSSDHPAFHEDVLRGQRRPLGHIRVADVCAAPGGKTAQLLSSGFGHVTAVRKQGRTRKGKGRESMTEKLTLALLVGPYTV